MRANFTLYTPEYISGVMSLRKPQKKSLEILDIIVNSVNLKKGMNLQAVLGAVKALYPTCTDFERDFMSLTFALATAHGRIYRIPLYTAQYQEFLCCRSEYDYLQ